MSDAILLLTGPEVDRILRGKEERVLDVIKRAYLAHRAEETVLPASAFLRFPQLPSARIIALPAYLGGDFEVAGIKWIASFPSNLARGAERASAVGVLNSMETGHAEVVMEASRISAVRTAASAALAGSVLHADRDSEVLGLVGLGPINFETTRYLRSVFPGLNHLVLFDASPERARQFAEVAAAAFGTAVSIEEDVGQVLEKAPLISFATNALEPHIFAVPDNKTILHVSLRDLSTGVIAAADNVVDDIDHVLNARTSVHLTEMELGHRDFIRCALPDILAGAQPGRGSGRTSIFSPFGMGILDLAVMRFVLDAAREEGVGTLIPDFVARPWTERVG